MPTTFCFDVEFVLVTCGADGCDQQFGMTRDFYNETRRTGLGWSCPRGHKRIWLGKTAEQKLEDAQARETALRDQLDASVREAEATRQQLLRDRQRFANGVCPCCNRSFENVRRHMTTQHPDYDVKQITQAVHFKCSCGRKFDTLRGLRVHQSRSRADDWTDPNTPEYWRHLTVGAGR